MPRPASFGFAPLASRMHTLLMHSFTIDRSRRELHLFPDRIASLGGNDVLLIISWAKLQSQGFSAQKSDENRHFGGNFEWGIAHMRGFSSLFFLLTMDLKIPVLATD